ncbi:hypothetical protein V5T82_03875 [Magnetovibrio sp. PR-2]|uniref:hypothetical protein n=1 Tax=Magnetovibrio sp. PR-2 TaxID=3120356 RepID=UPI002FCE0043
MTSSAFSLNDNLRKILTTYIILVAVYTIYAFQDILVYEFLFKESWPYVTIFRHAEAEMSIIFLASCALFFVALFKRRWFLALFVFVIYPVSTFFFLFMIPDKWEYGHSLEDTQGNLYTYLDRSFLQGQSIMLGRLRSRSIFFDDYEILLRTNGDAPRTYVQIVRPWQYENDYWHLHLTHTGFIIGLRGGGEMYFAYDINTGQAYDASNVQKLSPFLALTDADDYNERDFWLLVKRGLGERELLEGQARRDVVEHDLQNPHKLVRNLAHKVLQADEASKKKAQEYLGELIQ